MPLETQASTVSLSPSQGVDVGKIEKELAALWLDASAAEENTPAPGVTRACALNLVVYTNPGDDRDLLEDSLSRVSETHPGRILILVAYREEAEPRLEAYVSMRCRLSGGSAKQICGEQVTIAAGGPLVETAATAVEPLLVPDVPVYLWWKDIPHYQDKLFDRLSQMSDRLVIDSAAFDHPYDDLLRLDEKIADHSWPVRVSDLNWGRLTSWRTLLASFWDVDAYRSFLDQVNRISIDYRPGVGAATQVVPEALLLTGWLASRLGWVVAGGVRQTEGAIECNLVCDKRAVLLSFRPDQTSAPQDGMISSVTLARDDSADFSVNLRANGGQLETRARIGTAHTVGRLLTHEVLSEAERLSRELSFLSRDVIFEAAVAQAALLVKALITQPG
jgi:glucose-6-phosphate dehydrogenase assembly protein OpcA